jgi:hypothetical protein
MNKLLITTALIAATALTGIARANAETDCRISKAQFQGLANGISYTKAAAFLGCEGEEIGSVDLGRSGTVTVYKWNGYGSIGANANVSFTGGKLFMKAQYGLK